MFGVGMVLTLLSYPCQGRGTWGPGEEAPSSPSPQKQLSRDSNRFGQHLPAWGLPT